MQNKKCKSALCKSAKSVSANSVFENEILLKTLASCDDELKDYVELAQFGLSDLNVLFARAKYLETKYRLVTKWKESTCRLKQMFFA